MAEMSPSMDAAHRCLECSHSSNHGLRHETTCSQWTFGSSAVYSFVLSLGAFDVPATIGPYAALQIPLSSPLSKEAPHLPLVAIPLALLTPISKIFNRAEEQEHGNSRVPIWDLRTISGDVFEEFVLWVVNPPPQRVTRTQAQARRLIRGEQFLELYILGQEWEIPKLQNWALDEYYALLEGEHNPGATSIVDDLPEYWPRLLADSPLREWMYQLLGSEYEACLSVGVKWPGEDCVRPHAQIWLGIQNAVKDYRSGNPTQSMRDLIRGREWNEFYIKADSRSSDDSKTVEAGYKVAPAFDAHISTSEPSIVTLTGRSSPPAISTAAAEYQDESLEARMLHQISDALAKMSSRPGTPVGTADGRSKSIITQATADSRHDDVQSLPAALRLGADLPSPVTLTPEEFVVDGDLLVGYWKDLIRDNRVVRSSHSTYGFMVQDNSEIWRPVSWVLSPQAASKLAHGPASSRSPSLAASSPADDVEDGGRIASTESVRSHSLSAAPGISHCQSKEIGHIPAESSAIAESATTDAQSQVSTGLGRDSPSGQTILDTARDIFGKLRASMLSKAVTASADEAAKDRSSRKAAEDNIGRPDTPESEYEHYMHGSSPAATPRRVAAESDFTHDTNIDSFTDLRHGAIRHQQKVLPSMDLMPIKTATIDAAPQDGPKFRESSQCQSGILDLDSSQVAVTAAESPLPELSHTTSNHSDFSSGYEGDAEPVNSPQSGLTSPAVGIKEAMHENRLNTLADMAIANSSSRPSSSMSRSIDIGSGGNTMLQSGSRGPSFSPLSSLPPNNETQVVQKRERKSASVPTTDQQAEALDVEMLSDSFNSGSERDPSDDEDFHPPGNKSPLALKPFSSSPLAPAGGIDTPGRHVSAREVHTPTLKRELESDADDETSRRRSRPFRTRPVPKRPGRFEGSGMVVDHSPDAFPKREMQTMVFTMKDGRKVLEWTLK